MENYLKSNFSNKKEKVPPHAGREGGREGGRKDKEMGCVLTLRHHKLLCPSRVLASIAFGDGKFGRTI